MFYSLKPKQAYNSITHLKTKVDDPKTNRKLDNYCGNWWVGKHNSKLYCMSYKFSFYKSNFFSYSNVITGVNDRPTDRLVNAPLNRKIKKNVINFLEIPGIWPTCARYARPSEAGWALPSHSPHPPSPHRQSPVRTGQGWWRGCC